MKRIYLHILVCILMSMVFASASCQKIREEASLTLHFNMMQPLITRGGSEGAVVLNYVVKDGEPISCEWNETLAQTRAGNGNYADGGGWLILVSFLLTGQMTIL